MGNVLVDSSVLIDVFTADPVWGDWSQQQLETLVTRYRLFINPVIYAEISIGFARIEELEHVLNQTPLAYAELPRAALYLAGKAFMAYRRRGGTKTAPLPDFFIGAHAAVEGMSLLTRDPLRVRYAFPALTVIAP